MCNDIYLLKSIAYIMTYDFVELLLLDAYIYIFYGIKYEQNGNISEKNKFSRFWHKSTYFTP